MNELLEPYKDISFNRFDYSRDVGQCMEDIVRDYVLPSLGYYADPHKLFENGVDVVAYPLNVTTPSFVMEITNESIFSYIAYKRASSMVDNFNKYANKPHIVFTSFGDRPKKVKRLFKIKEIHEISVGFQTLPINYYNYFKSIDPKLVLFRKWLCSQTIDIIRSKILRAFKKIGLIPPIYESNTKESKINFVFNKSVRNHAHTSSAKVSDSNKVATVTIKSEDKTSKSTNSMLETTNNNKDTLDGWEPILEERPTLYPPQESLIKKDLKKCLEEFKELYKYNRSNWMVELDEKCCRCLGDPCPYYNYTYELFNELKSLYKQPKDLRHNALILKKKKRFMYFFVKRLKCYRKRKYLQDYLYYNCFEDEEY